eukprot:tig00000981_g5868.t1
MPGETGPSLVLQYSGLMFAGGSRTSSPTQMLVCKTTNESSPLRVVLQAAGSPLDVVVALYKKEGDLYVLSGTGKELAAQLVSDTAAAIKGYEERVTPGRRYLLLDSVLVAAEPCAASPSGRSAGFDLPLMRAGEAVGTFRLRFIVHKEGSPFHLWHAWSEPFACSDRVVAQLGGRNNVRLDKQPTRVHRFEAQSDPAKDTWAQAGDVEVADRHAQLLQLLEMRRQSEEEERRKQAELEASQPVTPRHASAFSEAEISRSASAGGGGGGSGGGARQGAAKPGEKAARPGPPRRSPSPSQYPSPSPSPPPAAAAPRPSSRRGPTPSQSSSSRRSSRRRRRRRRGAGAPPLLLEQLRVRNTVPPKNVSHLTRTGKIILEGPYVKVELPQIIFYRGDKLSSVPKPPRSPGSPGSNASGLSDAPAAPVPPEEPEEAGPSPPHPRAHAPVYSPHGGGRAGGSVAVPAALSTSSGTSIHAAAAPRSPPGPAAPPATAGPLPPVQGPWARAYSYTDVPRPILHRLVADAESLQALWAAAAAASASGATSRSRPGSAGARASPSAAPAPGRPAWTRAPSRGPDESWDSDASWGAALAAQSAARGPPPAGAAAGASRAAAPPPAPAPQRDEAEEAAFRSFSRGSAHFQRPFSAHSVLSAAS